jgi:hypothetical protein
MYSSDEKEIFEKIIADVTPQEIHFMKLFGIDDGDGRITNKEYVILIVVRIGAVRPELIRILHQRFKELDRKCAGFIEYDELMFRGIKVTAKDKFTRAVRKVIALSSIHKPGSKGRYVATAASSETVVTLSNDSATHTGASSQKGKVHCVDDGLSCKDMDEANVPVHLSVRTHLSIRERAGTFDSATSSQGSRTRTNSVDRNKEFDDCGTPRSVGSFTPRRSAAVAAESLSRVQVSPKTLTSSTSGEGVSKSGSGSGDGVSVFDKEEALSEAQRAAPTTPSSASLPRPVQTPARRVTVERLASIESVTTVGDADNEFSGIAASASGILSLSGDRDELMVSRSNSSCSLHGTTVAPSASSGKYFTFDNLHHKLPPIESDAKISFTKEAKMHKDENNRVDSFDLVEGADFKSPKSVDEAWAGGQLSKSNAHSANYSSMSSAEFFVDDSMVQSRIAATRLNIYDVAVAAVRQRRLSSAFRDKHAGHLRRKSNFGSFTLMLWGRPTVNAMEAGEEDEEASNCWELFSTAAIHTLRYNHYFQSVLAW